jgi:hypothetical protein
VAALLASYSHVVRIELGDEWDFAERDGVVYVESLPGPPVYSFYEVNLTRAFGYGADGMTGTQGPLPKIALRVAWLAAHKEDR